MLKKLILFLTISTLLGLKPSSQLFTINEIKSMLSSPNTEIIYETLLPKGYTFVKYKDEYDNKTWTYAFGYDDKNKKANHWIDYSTYDLNDLSKKYAWNKGWFNKEITDSPQDYYANSEIKFIWTEEENYNSLTSYIKSNYQKVETKFNESKGTYTYLYRNENFEFYFYQIDNLFYLNCEIIDSNKLKKIQEYRQNDLTLHKEYQKTIREKWEKEGGHSMCDCENSFRESNIMDELYYYCWSHIEEHLSPNGLGYYSNQIDSLFLANCKK